MKLYHPDHPDNAHPDPTKRKTLTPSTPYELERLLALGWKIKEEETMADDPKQPHDEVEETETVPPVKPEPPAEPKPEPPTKWVEPQ